VSAGSQGARQTTVTLQHGERYKALGLFAPVYGWFTEGFGTPDLIEAKELLDAL
jgi:hypothetical protein